MPKLWYMPKERKLEDEIANELARLEELKKPAKTIWQAEEEIPEPLAETRAPQAWQPQVSQPEAWMPQVGTLPRVTPEAPQPTYRPLKAKPEAEPEVPFWQRALQVFAAPFEWVDENVIKPGLSLASTTAGFVPEVARKPGEDFWEWKKRAWEGWEAPGVNINVPWDDKPWRVDIKGVAELAPWLLIPGAGQVGTATRAARGIAGVLGKVGRPIGYAIEYSPWGLVEKTAGVAIKGGIRGVGKVSERVSTAVGEKIFGKIPPPPPPTPAMVKLTQYMTDVARPGRKELTKAIPELRGKQLARIEKELAKAERGEISLTEAYTKAGAARAGGIKGEYALTAEALAARQAKDIAAVELAITKGEMSREAGSKLINRMTESPAYKPVTFSKAEVEEFLNAINSSIQDGFTKADSGTALLEFLTQGKMPQPHNLRDWARVFGDDFAKAVGKLQGMSQGSRGKIVDALNLPRAVLASSDLSATLRQGLILSLLHPTKVPVWFGRQIKSLFSEKLALQSDDALRARPLFKEFESLGGYIAPMKGAIPTKAEELFMSDFARRVPFVRRSERAFITYLNEARMTAFEAAHGAMAAQGATAAQFKILAEFINMASGRGTLPAVLEKYSPVLNTVLFSPRLQAATLLLPRQIGRMLLSGNPYMRKEAAKALITFVGGGSAILGLLKATGNKVELDPRSGDFAKVIIGETRLDIWRGYVQYTRFAAQMLTGERKSAYGNMNKAQRDEISWRFLQSKSSPAFGLMADLLRGETYMGRPVFSDTTGFAETLKERVLPLALQDVIDAMEQSGTNSLWIAAPVFLGVGALTYIDNYVKVKAKIAREMGFKSWDDIDPKTRREIQNRNTELQAATIEYDRRVMGTAWGDWRIAGNAIEDGFKENVDLAVAQYQATGDGYTFRGKISDAFTERRGGYDARSREARFEDIVKRLETKDTAEALVSLGPEQLAIRAYNDALWGNDMYDEFGDYRFDEADIRKEQLRRQLGDEMFNYVEEYRGLKYETFPPEYQELVRAKKVLRPYWDVKSWAEKTFGKPKTDWQKRRVDSIISKIRKRLRLTNPEMEKYYQMFYVRT